MSTESPTINAGEVFNLFAEEPNWGKKCLIVGACTLIPLVGPFQLLGYSHRCYDHAKAGLSGMPDPVLGADIGSGFFMWLKQFCNVFPITLLVLTVFFGCAFGPALLAGGAQAATGSEEPNALVGLVAMAGVLGGYAFLFIAMFGIGILFTDISRRIFNGETLPVFSPGESIGAIKRSPGAFAMTWLLLMMAGVVGSLGVFACYIGALFTLPLSMALRGRVLAQWDRVVQANRPEIVDPY